jgi:alanyl-tRNA synthetase
VTERVYYTDSTCRTFDAKVTRSLEHQGRPAVILDRTAFYPTSGGQPNDTGQLSRIASPSPIEVIDVIDGDDDILHVIAVPLEEGTVVRGDISWPRRFDHMQQHTGQHVLSAAFERVTGTATVSFHMGAQVSTIDLSREVSAAEIAQAEDEANRVVWDDTPVAVRFVSAAEAAALSLRKEPARAGTLRLIEIPGFDLSACGGTHVSRTGAIGLIAVLGSERSRGGSRLTFVCGQRALASLRSFRDAIAGSIRQLSVPPGELPGAIERLQQDAVAQRKQARELQNALAGYEAAAMLEAATVVGSTRVVVRAMEGRDAHALKALASAMAGAGHAIVALLTAEAPMQAVIARSADAHVDAGAILRKAVERFGGKGGGRPELAQGGGLAGDPREIVWVISGLIEEALSG